MILGLSPETFAASGIPNLDSLQRDVANACAEMEPPIRATFDAFILERSRRVLVVSVPECERSQRPCFYRPRGLSGGSYVRLGDTDRQMTDYEVQACLAARGQPQEDLRLIEDLNWDALDPVRLGEFFVNLRNRRPGASHLVGELPELAVRYRIVRKDAQDRLVPTVAGLLMFGKFPQADFPNLAITLVRYAGSMNDPARDSAQMLDNQRLEGPLPQMIAGCLAAIRRNMQVRTLKAGLISEEILEYPELALREVLVNSVGHRDYGPGALGSQVQVKMFTDGIIIQNPGGLFGPVTEDTLDHIGVQATRNVQLMRLLEESGLAENRGSGIRTVVSQLARAHLPPPDFLDGRTFFRVTFSNEALLDQGTVDWLNQFSVFPINERQRLSLALVRKHGRIRNLDYCRLTQCDSRQATADLAGMRELKLVRQIGERRWAVYELAPGYFDSPGLPKHAGVWKPRHRVVFSFIQREGITTVKSIVEGCDMTLPYARLTVRELLRLGAIEPTERNRRSPKQAYRVRTPKGKA